MRECGSCGVCCIELNINVPELKKPKGIRCPHLSSEMVHRCTIYSTRPKVCQIYSCYWLNGHGSKDGRPNQSGILINDIQIKRDMWLIAKELEKNTIWTTGRNMIVETVRQTKRPVLIKKFKSTAKIADYIVSAEKSDLAGQFIRDLENLEVYELLL